MQKHNFKLDKFVFESLLLSFFLCYAFSHSVTFSLSPSLLISILPASLASSVDIVLVTGAGGASNIARKV